MPTRVDPLRPGQSPDNEVNELIQSCAEGWWQDTSMFGVIGRRPDLLKSIVPVFVSFFANGIVEPHIHEMMRIKTGLINDCAY